MAYQILPWEALPGEGVKPGKHAFFLKDGVHFTTPRSPMAYSLWFEFQKMAYALVAEGEGVPGAKGEDWIIVDGQVYQTMVPLFDEEENKRREVKSRQYLAKFIENFEKEYGDRKAELTQNMEPFLALDVGNLSDCQLWEKFEELLRIQNRSWYIHFEVMFAALAGYVLFEQICKERFRNR